MDFWSRIIGGAPAPKKPAPITTANDPGARLIRFKNVYNKVLELCNRPPNVSRQPKQLAQLRSLLDRVVVLLREETRAPVPHTCLQYAASSQIYTVVGRAATLAQNEAVTHAAVGVFAALIDSEEEEFLAHVSFAKSLMRLITRVIDSGNVLVGIDTETAILEVLFTIAAKIRLQPEILSVWFRSTAKPELEDVFVKEKKSFVGITQKEDFPLCYLLIDRVHHEGRIGDFARTGLLYIFEATGRSSELEEWVVSSDLPTLMASGLGALYSQLSRELSIIQPDTTLPAVLAMSDYSTTHLKTTAESAFSEKHRSHMSTFLSYLFFWQDVLDHCRSADVKQTLLDHFQILFLQQLLYPSMLQSSDTDAGSSVAVLTYLTAMLESLEYPELIQMMLNYLLAIKDDQLTTPVPASAPSTPRRKRPSMPPRSPTTLKRRQSLLLMTMPKNAADVVEPNMFNLVDLMINSTASENAQTAQAALGLLSTMMTRHKGFAIGTLLKVQRGKTDTPTKTVGALELEVDQYLELAAALHGKRVPNAVFSNLADDLHCIIEAQVPFTAPADDQSSNDVDGVCAYSLSTEDPLLRSLAARLTTFLTNSVEINLALTQAIISVATCTELQLDTWLALTPSSYSFADTDLDPPRSWQAHLEVEDDEAWSALQQAARRPLWTDDYAPIFFTILQALHRELEGVRTSVPQFGQLLAARQRLLRAANLDAPLSEPSSPTSSPAHSYLLEVAKRSEGQRRSSSTSSLSWDKATNIAESSKSPPSRSWGRPSTPLRPSSGNSEMSPSKWSIFQPPPPETPSTTDVLMQSIKFPVADTESHHATEAAQVEQRSASLNHVLTNVVILQEFALELVAVLQVRAAVLGEKEVRYV